MCELTMKALEADTLLEELHKPTVITLKGSSMFCVPGVIRAMTHDYRIGVSNPRAVDEGLTATRWRAIRTVSDGWNLPVFRVEQLLSGQCQLEEHGNDLIVSFPN